MLNANATAGTVLPNPGLDPAQIVSAIDYLWMAHRLIDNQRATWLPDLPEEARSRATYILEGVLDALTEQRSECCEALYEIMRGTGAADAESKEEGEE